jgi:hypothetical protein
MLCYIYLVKPIILWRFCINYWINILWHTLGEKFPNEYECTLNYWTTYIRYYGPIFKDKANSMGLWWVLIKQAHLILLFLQKVLTNVFCSFVLKLFIFIKKMYYHLIVPIWFYVWWLVVFLVEILWESWHINDMFLQLM